MINPKHCKFTFMMLKEVKIGTPIEMEHTKSKRKAKFIAMQHVCEFPYYYSKGLLPMEKRLRRSRR